MAAEYKLVRNPNPHKDGEEQPYHARLVSKGTMDVEEFMEWAKVRSSFSTADIIGVVQLLQDMIVDGLKFGYNIELEGIGVFSASLKCRSTLMDKKIRAESIHFKDVNFRASKKLKDRLRSMDVSRAEEVKKKEFSPEEREQRLLSYLETRKFITCRTYMRLNQISRSQATKEIHMYLSNKVLTCHGNGPTTFYMKKEVE